MRRMPSRLLLALLSVFVLFGNRTARSELQIGSPTPVRIDLRAVNSAIAGTRSLSAEFLDDSTIAVVYTSDGPQNGDINLHLATIDISTTPGKQLGSVALGSQEGFPTLAAVGERQLFVVWKQEATLYDVSLRALKRQTVRSGLARLLPGGTTVVLWPHEPTAPLQRIDMKSMAVTDIQTPQGPYGPMSDALRRASGVCGEWKGRPLGSCTRRPVETRCIASRPRRALLRPNIRLTKNVDRRRPTRSAVLDRC